MPDVNKYFQRLDNRRSVLGQKGMSTWENTFNSKTRHLLIPGKAKGCAGRQKPSLGIASNPTAAVHLTIQVWDVVLIQLKINLNQEDKRRVPWLHKEAH
jgi:hypothetical protein